MELTPTPPDNDDDDNTQHGRGGLVWDPAGARVDARLGPYRQAVVDYLLHPPPGYPVPGGGLPKGVALDRSKALEEMIKMAFQP